MKLLDKKAAHKDLMKKLRLPSNHYLTKVAYCWEYLDKLVEDLEDCYSEEELFGTHWFEIRSSDTISGNVSGLFLTFDYGENDERNNF